LARDRRQPKSRPGDSLTGAAELEQLKVPRQGQDLALVSRSAAPELGSGETGVMLPAQHDGQARAAERAGASKPIADWRSAGGCRRAVGILPTELTVRAQPDDVSGRMPEARFP